MLNITFIQKLLNEYQIDGWLFTDFHGQDRITRDFLKLGKRTSTRRLFYYIPATGPPIKLLSAIEPLLLDHLPGELRLYQGFKNQQEVLAAILLPGCKIACQYSPGGNVPTISTIDAGLLEYLKTFGICPVSSADLMQYFGAVLTPEQVATHQAAGVIIHRILDQTFAWIRLRLDAGLHTDEWMLLQEMERLIAGENIVMDGPPFFGIDEHAADPGYEPTPDRCSTIKEGSRLIIDIAGRLPADDAIYYDVSWCMQIGHTSDLEYERLFKIVHEARDTAFHFIQDQLNMGHSVRGCEVDDVTRAVFERFGLSDRIMHRTGHNIGHQCHGLGANLDNYETHDDRLLLPGTLFSIEPGLYTKSYGVRLEYDVYISSNKKLCIYAPIQDEILYI